MAKENEKASPALGIANVRAVQKDELLDAVREYYDAGLRFVTMTGFDRGDGFEVLYHFDENLALRHLQVKLARDEALPSISGVYLCAFLSENEIKELFGIKITGIAIDYNGRLLIAENCPATPMLKDLAANGTANGKTSGATKVIQTRAAQQDKKEGE